MSILKHLTEKDNKIYVFTGDNGWKLLAVSDFAPILSRISKELIDDFAKWQDEHTSDLYTDAFSTIYLANLKKINSINLNHHRIQLSLYKQLYQKLKQTLLPIDYEIL